MMSPKKSPEVPVLKLKLSGMEGSSPGSKSSAWAYREPVPVLVEDDELWWKSELTQQQKDRPGARRSRPAFNPRMPDPPRLALLTGAS